MSILTFELLAAVKFRSIRVVDHGVNEGEPIDEQYCEQVNEDQFRDPELEGQDFPEGFEDGKFNPILRCMFLS